MSQREQRRREAREGLARFAWHSPAPVRGLRLRGENTFPPAALLVVVHLIVSAWHTAVLPILEGPDEHAHFQYVRYIVEQRALPRFSREMYEAYQPPLFYLLDAALTFWTPTGETPPRNPYWAFQHTRPGVDNKNIYLHSPDEDFPYRGLSLAVHAARVLSVLCGAGTVALVYLITRQAFPGRPRLAFAATAFAAFLPGFFGSVSAISNDTLATLLASGAIYVTVRGLRRGFTRRLALALGCLGGFILLTKLTTIFVIGPALAAIVVGSMPGVAPGVAPGGRSYGASGGAENLKFDLWILPLTLPPLILIPLPWLIRNQMLYGDFTSLREFNRVLGHVREGPLTAALFAEQLWVNLPRFYAIYAWGQVPFPDWVYALWIGLTLISLVGMGKWLRRQLTESPISQLQPLPAALALATIAALSVAGTVAYIVVNLHGSPPRLFLIPAIAAIAPMLALGWAEWLSDRRRDWKAAWAFAAAMLGFALVGLLFVLRPAFSRPWLAPDAPLPVESIEPPIRLGDSVELIGGSVRPTRVAPGGEVTAIACWRTLGPTPDNLSEFVHIVDADNNKVGERETYPGLGRLPSVHWMPGGRFCDEIRVPLRPWGGGPALLPVAVGYFDENGTLAASSEGQPIENLVTIGRVAVSASAPPELGQMTALPATFGGAIDLLGYQVLSPQADDGQPSLRLYWKSRAAVTEDYVVFVHWLDAAGQPIGLSDSQPRSGWYPTSAWTPGEIIADDHPLPVSEFAPGLTRFEVGLYLPATGERLSTDPTQAGDAVVFSGPELGEP